MDTIETTVTEDALAKDAKSVSAANPCEKMKSAAGKPDGGKTSFGPENEKNECCEEPDDLLEKIEEAVKDKVAATDSNIENDISQSSEDEFLKKLEELEKDNNAAAIGDGASGANIDECDKITVGKLVLEISANKSQAESNGEEHINELSSTTDEKRTEKGEEKGKDKDSKQTEEKSSEDASCDLKKNGKLQDDSTEGAANKGEQNEASGAPEVEIIEAKAPTVSSTEEKKTEASSSSETVEDVADIPKEGEKVEKTSHENEEAIGSTTADEKFEEAKSVGEAPKAEEKKEVEKTNEASSEAMAVDDDDDLMEVDIELKMDVDADDDDDDCQIIDDEMAPVAESSEKQQAKDSKDLGAEVQEPIVDSAKNEVDDDVQIVEPASDAAKESESNEAKAEEKVSKNETPKKQEQKSVIEEKTPDSTTVSSQSENISLNVGKTSEKKATGSQVLSPGPSKKDSPEATPKKLDSPISLKKAECGSSTEQSDEKLSKIEYSSSKPQAKFNAKILEVEASPKKSSLQKTAPQSTEKENPKVSEITQDTVKDSESLPDTKSVEPEKSTKDKCIIDQKLDGVSKSASKVFEAAAKDTDVVKEATPPKEVNTANKVTTAVISPKRSNSSSPTKKLIASSSAKVDEKQPEADSTKGEGKSAKGNTEKVSENLLEDEKISESDPTPSQKEPEGSKTTEVKEHYSDTTASLSSTADEQILKLCMDTTLPNTEVDNEHASLKIENKALKDVMKHGGSIPSLNTTPDLPIFKSTSTPIQKQFDISTEATETSRKMVEDDLHHTTKSSKNEYSSDTCTTTDHHHSSSSDQPQSDHQSSGSVTKYVNTMKKFNGITDSTTDDDSAVHIKNTHSSEPRIISSAGTSDLKSNNVYEINVQYDDRSEISFLSIEKLDSKKLNAVLLEKTISSEVSDQGSSNGSVTSLTPFSLPVPRLSEVSSSSSGSTLPQEDKSSSSHSKRRRFTLQGTGKLCNFIIEEFTKLKKTYSGDLPTNMPTESKDLKIHDEATTPKSREYTKKYLTKGKSASPAVSDSSPSPLRSEPKRSRKRSFTKSQDEDDEDEGKSKAKQPRKSHSKSQGTPSKEIESSHCELTGQCVLAKWVDKKYYAGRIRGEKPGNKYVVLFEDGALKTLPKDSIVFGEGDTLPLKDMHVHGLVDDDFENGIVISIDKVGEKVLYTVQAELKQVKITASDIYLTEEQAKAVQGVQNAQKKGATAASSPEESTSSVSAVAGSRSTRNKRASTSPVTPEPGYSGGVGKKGSKRQKRVPLTALNRISESSELSDTQDSSPASPDVSLELVEGLQPELQRTDKDAELSKMIFIADYLECHPTSNPQEMLGKLPNSKTLFRNKFFILTCTVGLKPHRFAEVDDSNVDSKNRQFSKVPFVKSFLQKQIEEGGGVVFKYFDEIPKKKYRQCKLIAPQPCLTAKYVQCLAADIQAVSHEWIIDSCSRNILEDVKKYVLPSGWSILTETYIRWDVGKSAKQRLSKQPLNKTVVLLGSGHKEFIAFWSRICKLAGATIRYIKYIDDVTPTTKGIMVCDLDFPDIIKSKAAHFDIPIVSTVWIIQCLINGRVCEPNANPKLQQIFPDDDF